MTARSRGLGSNSDYDQAVARALPEATRIAVREVEWIPLHIRKNIRAMRRGLVHTPRADAMTPAQDAGPGSGLEKGSVPSIHRTALATARYSSSATGSIQLVLSAPSVSTKEMCAKRCPAIAPCQCTRPG